MITKNCETCENVFTTYSFSIRLGQGKFCSTKCIRRSEKSNIKQSMARKKLFQENKLEI